MKALKITGLVVAGVVVLGAIILGLALTPALQTWAVRKAVAGQPGMTVEVDRVAAGFSDAEVVDLRYAQDGIVVTAKGVSAKYSAMDYLTGNRVNADSLTINELVVDLRNPTPKPAASAPAPTATTAPAAPKPPFAGLLQSAQLPMVVRLAALSTKGRILLPQQQTLVFELKGSDLETGRRGKIEWILDFDDAKPAAPLRALRATGSAVVQIAADGRIDLVEVDTIAAAMGPKLPADRIQLTAKIAQPAASGNETYAAVLNLLRGTAVEPLLKVNAQYTAAQQAIAGDWNLAVRSEQLAAVLAGFGLPEIAANGTGRFTFNPVNQAVAATGSLTAQLSKLALLAPALEAVGSVSTRLTFDGAFAGERADLNRLEFDATAADGRRILQVVSAQKIGYDLVGKRVTFADAKAELARVTIQALPLAWAQPVAKPLVIDSGDLSLSVALEAEPDGSRVRVRTLEPLTLRAVTVRDGQTKLADNLNVSVRPAVDYSATRVLAELADLKISLPAGDSVAGKLTADVTNVATKPAIAFTAALQGKLLAALKPYLPLDPGALTFDLAAAGRLEGDALQLTQYRTTVNRDAGGLLVSVELQQPIAGDLKAKTFAGAKPDAVAARVRLGDLPLSWADAFVPNAKFSGTAGGAVLDLTLKSLDDLAVAFTEPLQLRQIGAVLEGRPQLEKLDLTARLGATKRGALVTFDVKQIELKQGNAVLLGFSAVGETKLPAKPGDAPMLAAKGNLSADVPALMLQPGLAPYCTLSRGQIAATFDVALAAENLANVVFSAKNLVAKADNRALGDLEFTLKAAQKADGSGTVQLPLTLTNAQRKSDLTVNAAFGKAAAGKTFVLNGKVASANLFVADFEPLAALAPASEPAKPAPVTPADRKPALVGPKPTAKADPKPTRDLAPFWQGVNGKVELDLKRVVYGADAFISGIRGSATITDSRLALDGFEGRFKENPFKLAGGVTFSAQQPQPYALAATADVQQLDIGEILRAANPNEKPPLETQATVSAKLNGNGGNVADLAKNAFGRFELTGTKGTMRYLARKGNLGTVVNIASFGLAMLGAKQGSDTTVAVAELARALNEVQFDSVKLQVERGADLSFKLTSLEFISPILRLTGNGSVAAKDPEQIKDAPMNVLLQLGAKGELALLLQRVGQLGGTQDEKGYYLMSRNFSIGGTPAKPDNSALWKLLLEAGLGALGR